MRSRLRQLAPRVARLSAFVLVVTIAVHLLLARLVRAETESALLELGSGLAQLEAAGGARGDRVVELNGARVQLAVHGVDQALDAVLDGAESECSPAGGRAMRGSDGGRGFVVCSLPPAPAGTVIGEVREVRPTYRYLYGQESERGTLTVSVLIDGALDLAALFPAEGDAPGTDPAGIPRPPGARRTLSTRELGAPQEIAMYLAERGDPAELEAWYRARLPAQGWRLLATPRADKRPRVLLVERAGDLVALVFADDAVTGGASVVVLTSLEDMEEGT